MSEEEIKAIEDLKILCNEVLGQDDCYKYESYSASEIMTMVDIVLNLIDTQSRSVQILVAQKDEFEKDADKWFRKLQEEHTKYEKINDRKNKIIDKLITALAEERGTDEDEIREVFECE